MKFSISKNRAAAWKPLVLATAVSSLFVPNVYAVDDEVKILAPVVVTASRFSREADSTPVAATVITAEEIENTGIDNVNEAVRKIGGVYGRQSAYGTEDYELDLRGFGTNSSQNMVVMIDGIRLSENELTASLLSSIPIDTVERIEIIRGGSSVLYGDGATGGVIHVITKRGKVKGTQGSVNMKVGQFNYREARISLMKGWDGFSMDASASKMKSDNYRDNNEVSQNVFSGGMQWASDGGRAGLRVNTSRQDSGLAGALSLAQYNANPRQADTPNDYASIDTNRITAFLERQLAAWEMAAELSYRERDVHSVYVDYASQATYKTKQAQFSPRARHLGMYGEANNELVAGLDFAHWKRVENGTYSQSDAVQDSYAAYLRDEVKWGKAKIAVGFRHEVFDKKSTGSDTYGARQSLNAWEALGSYALAPKVNTFAKVGRSYRVANVDENAATVVANVLIEPQTSNDFELGVSFADKGEKLTVRLFQHRLRNEIFYDPTAGMFGANVNLDPTRRRGIEVEASARLASEWMLGANFQHVQAEFTGGANAGHEMVMVPKNTASMRFYWLPASNHNASFGVQWVDEQRYGGDFDNTADARIPSHVTLDARYARKLGQWELAISATNLTNKRYFSNAYGDGETYWGIYPESGRQLKFSARYDF